MTHALKRLCQLDPRVWNLSASKIIRWSRIPCVSKTHVDKEFGLIYYRSLYYYSGNSRYPYVCLFKHRSLDLPLVQCCSKPAYESFLRAYQKGEFADPRIRIIAANSYREEVCDL